LPKTVFTWKFQLYPHFFLFPLIFLKTTGQFLLLISIIHQGFSLFYQKPPLKFEIEEWFRQVMLYTDKNKKNTPTIIKSIHSSTSLWSNLKCFDISRIFGRYCRHPCILHINYKYYIAPNTYSKSKIFLKFSCFKCKCKKKIMKYRKLLKMDL